MMRAAAIFPILALAICVPARADWVRLTAPGLEIYTDDGAKTARRAFDRLQQVSAAFPAEPAGAVPLRLFLFDSEREFRRFSKNQQNDAFFQSGLERHYIVTYAGAGLSRVLVHEYLHFLLNQSPVPRPPWFEEGTAEFYSNLELRGGELRIGRRLDEHRSLLKREAPQWLDAAQLAAGPEQALESGERLGSLYYAQSWALVHMLNLEQPYRDSLPRFVELLAGELDPADAFAEAFGRTIDQALAELPAYLDRMRETRLEVAASGAAEEPAVEEIGELDALLITGELALRCGRVDTARSRYEQAYRDYPDDPAAEVGMGVLARAEGRDADARQHLENALGLHGGAESQDAAAWFTYAMLEQDDGAPEAHVRELLDKVTRINPDFGEAHLLLGVRATDDGDLASAVEHLRQAARLMPKRSYVWHALAYAQDKLEEPGAAIESAYRALHTAATPEQRGMAEALLGSLREAALEPGR